ncbi:hypothetical protein [Gulosibacter sp. 10]|uniref:hypothetical protein n=1 Tax=Gulosibacter sp. 10 TaxID=1255570 RepID=UPI0011236EDA|nr:hypothetical protein [Gulosibacter sp. 10]
MRRAIEATTIGAVAAHHGIESAAGLGLPGEPYLGRRKAVLVWAGLFTANLLLLTRRGVGRDAAAGFANGTYQALALQHYVDWPWRFRNGVPVLTEAEGLPKRVLPAYNVALLMTIAGSTAALIASRRRAAAVIGHLAGLATLPLQLASARHHIGWWRSRPRRGR